MGIEIVPYTSEFVERAKEFNNRLRAREKTEFLLDEQTPRPQPDGISIRNFHYLAADQDAVRGGLLIVNYPAWLGDEGEITVLNYREPLSEGIIDSKYSLLGLRLLKFVEKQGRYIFALGMGSETAPFTRILKSAGWSVRPVPFWFRVLRAGRFLRELQLLKSTRARALMARAAALTGAGKTGITVLQAKSYAASVSARMLSAEPVNIWDSWADELWDRARSQFSFAVRRDRKTLTDLYQLGRDRSQCVLVRKSGEPVGWIAFQISEMRDDKYFGNMRVGTILDSVSVQDSARGCLALSMQELKRQGADLVVANEPHSRWIEAFRGAGFLTARSNYILATSKALTEAISRQANGWERIHLSRGDGDGRYHL